MNRHFGHGYPESLEYRRSQPAYDTASNHTLRESPRVFPTRTNPQEDNDSEKGDHQPRKRISLACSRCRKRKIKCSGDIAGTGCLNCKNAGNEECNFLRVNSTTLLAPPPNADYPYSNAMPMSTSRGGSMAGLPYSSSYGPLQPAGALSMHGSPFNFRNGSMNGHHYPIGPTRHSHPSTATNYNIGGLNEDVFDTYAQVPQYLLPGQDPQAAMSSYATHDMSRNWTPTSSSKPLTGYEHYSNSQFPHMNSSAMAAAGTEDSLLSRQGSRILPHPRKTSVDPSSHSYPKPGEFTSYLPLGYGQRSSVAYSPQTSVNWGSQGSASSTSLSSYSGPVSSASSSPPTECHTTPFGYNLSVCTTPIQPAVQPSRAPEDEPINDRTIRRRSLGPSRTTNVHTNAPIHVSSKAYSYNLNNGGKSDSAKEVSSPEFNTLVNKKPYQPIREKPINYNPSAPLPTEKASMIPTSKPTSTVAARQR